MKKWYLSQGFKWILGFFYGWILILSLLFGNAEPTWAATPERPILTLEILQERVRSPIQSDGVKTIDLHGFEIDLGVDNPGFSEQFYASLQTVLQRSASPLALDLSGCRIQGDFNGSLLGLRAPLYGQALLPIFTPAEQAQLERDRLRLIQLDQLTRTFSLNTNRAVSSPVDAKINVFRGVLKLSQTQFAGRASFANTFFLNRVEAQGTTFEQETDFSDTRFSQLLNLSGAIFRQELQFRDSFLLAKAQFQKSRFQEITNFRDTEFQETTSFAQAIFQQVTDWTETQWLKEADFEQSRWQEGVIWTKSQFRQGLNLTAATFAAPVSFQEMQIAEALDLRGTSLAGSMDFSDATFMPGASLQVAGLQFDPDRAKLLGNPGQLGRIISVPRLPGNETLLRQLVRNFRQLEQISDANQVEYTTEWLRSQELWRQLWGVNINRAASAKLQKVGFNPEQVQAILNQREQQPFRSLTDLLLVSGMDWSTVSQVRDRILLSEVTSLPESLLSRLPLAWQWLSLNVLLCLSRFGTSVGLVLGVGTVAIAYFGGLFWLLDRWRRWKPQPILPPTQESISMFISGVTFSGLGLITIFRISSSPWLTLGCLASLILPIPTILLVIVYSQGRYHKLIETSYFVEDGSFRELRFLIGRLPVIPRFPLFRDRYQPILWDRRWNWLNYYDLSLNNFLKFGFNDVRLRDEAVPGLITALIWYQWSLGLLYFTLLLWTLSRTIPGLNLLIYFK